MSNANKAMLRTWVNTFMSAILASLTTILVTTQSLALDWVTLQAVLYSGVIAVLPVIKNYFDKGYDQYGKQPE
jgi:hypothetical protein